MGTQETTETTSGPAALAITHEHGVDASAHTSREAAEAALLEYVRAWWAVEAGEGVPMPEDPSEAIEAYFLEHTPQEDYEITVAS